MKMLIVVMLALTTGMILMLVFYPFLSWIRCLLLQKQAGILPSFSAPVSIIISCYNEEPFIREKIESFLDSAEWIPGSELLVVSGGSTDQTNAILEEFRNHPDIRLFIFPERLGKINSVNIAVAASQNEILIFSDCRQRMKRGAVKQLISRFSDPEVGTVNSTLHDARRHENGSAFRRLLNRVALNDSASGSALNLYGALYAQRRSVFRPIPANILHDDLFVVVSTISQGKRLVQEQEAVIYDMRFGHYYSAERIERLTRGLLIFLFRYKQQILQLPFPVMFRFLLFKYVKLLLPFLLLTAAGCTLYLTAPVLSGWHGLVVVCGTVVIFLFPKMRAALFLLFRINHYMMKATIRFLFFNERSVSWQKLPARS